MRRSVPQVPGGLLFGNLSELRADRVGMLERLPRSYGDVARLRIGAVRAFVVSSPELAQATLVGEADAFHKGFGLSTFARPMLGDGLLTSEGQVHKRQRRLLAPAFIHRRIASYADSFGHYAERSLQRLLTKSELDLTEEMMLLTFEIVGKTLFDADVSGDASVVGAAVTDAMEQTMGQMFSRLPLPPGFPTPANLRVARSVRRLDEIVYRLIRERRAMGEDRGDLLSMLLQARDEEDKTGMTDRQVRDEAMTLMLAGHETTANALAWTFLLLATHPEVRARLEQELDTVLGGRVPSVTDLPRLVYTLQVLKEAMRLYPPAYMVSRRAQRDVSVCDVELRKGDLVVVNIFGMQRRPEYFPNPVTFEPERFAPGRESSLEKGAYLPFGGGSRVCIGNHFALMEGQILLAHLAQHLRFELIPGRAFPTPEGLITLRPKGGLHVRVVPRRRPRVA